MTDSRAPVTPEELKQAARGVSHKSDGDLNVDQWTGRGIRCLKTCPACALNKAAEALREAQDRADREELGRIDAEGALWRVVPNTHAVPQQDPFEGPGETYRDAYHRLAEDNWRLHVAVRTLRRNFVIHSDDAGLALREALELLRTAKRNEERCQATGSICGTAMWNEEILCKCASCERYRATRRNEETKP